MVAFLDLAAVLAGFLIVGLWFDPAPDRVTLLVSGSFAAVTFVAAVAWRGLDPLEATVLHLEEMQRAVKCMALAALVTAAAAALIPWAHPGALPLIAACALATVLVILERRLVIGVLGRLHHRVSADTRVLIYGSGPSGQLLMKKLLQSRDLHRAVVGFVDDYAQVGQEITCRVSQFRGSSQGVPILGREADLSRLVDEFEIDEMLVTTSAADMNRVRELSAARAGLRVAFLPDLVGLRADQLEVQEVGALPLLQPVEISKGPGYHVVKRALDLAVSAALLIAFLPLWTVIAVAIRLDSSGPIIFRQKRVGLDGRLFTLFKFRTLRLDSDPYARSQSVRDTRATRIGRLLRVSGLDEIPQLLNILRGEMSLVGPRPEMPFIADEYTPLQRLRLTAKPGVTGVWQLSPDREGSAIHDNIEYDLYYIRSRSILLDILILFETVFFTLDLLVAAMQEAARQGQPSSVGSEASSAGAGPSAVGGPRGGRLLLLLDQRRDHGAMASWQRDLADAVRLAGASDSVLEVLAARSNVPVLNEILHGGSFDPPPASGRVRFIPYEAKGGVEAAIRDAGAVATEVPVLEDLVRRLGVPLVQLRGDPDGPRVGRDLTEAVLLAKGALAGVPTH